MRRFFEWVLLNKLVILFLAILVLVTGWWSYRNLPLDAFPDVSPNLVQIFTETEGLAPEEVEKYVTYPIEVAMNGLPGVKKIRSVSNFGLSVVNVYFEDNVDIYFARQVVNERLQEAREQIPEEFGEPQMGPITTGMGVILYYLVEDTTGRSDLMKLREVQDWIVKYNLQTVPGVTEVLSLGGFVRQYQVLVHPAALLKYDLTLADIADAVRRNNANTGAQFIIKNREELLVRSEGMIQSLRDLEQVVVKVEDGQPVYLRDVATITFGGAIRRGLATMNGEGEVVAGLVLKLFGENTARVIQNVHKKIQDINRMLPEGFRILPYYDQAKLVFKSIETVSSALLQGIVLIIMIQFLLVGGLRPSLVVLGALPFSLAVAVILMRVTGMSANLMTFGGLAIAIGMLVDGAVVMVENMARWLKERPEGEPAAHAIVRAATEVARPVFFATLIIILVFAPILALSGVEGKMFRPLATTVVYALMGALLYALFLSPVLGVLVLRSSRKADFSDRILNKLFQIYSRPLRYFVDHPGVGVALAVILLLLGGVGFSRLGSEFVPRIDEGDILIRMTMAPSISIPEAKETVLRVERRILEEFPEVERVVTRIGRGETGAHSDPTNTAEAFIQLKDKKHWRFKNVEELLAAMSEMFETFPGVLFNFSQPIAMSIDELLTGVRAELAIKIFGPDIDTLKMLASQVEAIIREIPGAADVQKDQITGTPQVRVRINRDALSRYGIQVEDVHETLRMAIGGEAVSQVFEGVKRFDVFIRYVPEARSTVEAIRDLLVPGPNGLRLPLKMLAEVDEVVGPRQITREDNQRFITVQCNVRGRDMGSFVEEAQKRIEAQVTFPPGYHLTWGGQFELQQEANRRLMVVIPLTLLTVFVLLYMSFNHLKSALLILLNIPLALVGGVFALLLTGQNLSVPASIGFISLFGIALSNGMVLVTYYNQLLREGLSLRDAVIRGSLLRLRPVLMTAATTALGLLPMLFATGTGSEVQKPLATVVMGGLFTSTVLTLLVLPAVYRWFAYRPEVETVHH